MKYTDYCANTILKKFADSVVEGSSVKTFPSARDFVIRDHMGYKLNEPREATLHVPNGDIPVRIAEETFYDRAGISDHHTIKLVVADKMAKRHHDEVDAMTYGINDVAVTKAMDEAIRSIIPVWIITKVIFNDPATIVYWRDGSRTVVKAMDGEQFDPEKGLAMAICKKLLGTSESGGNYYDIFKKWLPKESEEKQEIRSDHAPLVLHNYSTGRAGGCDDVSLYLYNEDDNQCETDSAKIYLSQTEVLSMIKMLACDLDDLTEIEHLADDEYRRRTLRTCVVPQLDELETLSEVIKNK